MKAIVLQETASGCHECVSHARNHFGYPMVGSGAGGQAMVMHRKTWEETYGPIPAGACVLHRCDNPPCQNPEHLFLGTRGDNNRDRNVKDRQATGRTHGKAKLTWSAVCRIREGRESGLKLAKELGVSHQAIYQVRNRKSWLIP